MRSQHSFRIVVSLAGLFPSSVWRIRWGIGPPLAVSSAGTNQKSCGVCRGVVLGFTCWERGAC